MATSVDICTQAAYLSSKNMQRLKSHVLFCILNSPVTRILSSVSTQSYLNTELFAIVRCKLNCQCVGF